MVTTDVGGNDCRGREGPKTGTIGDGEGQRQRWIRQGLWTEMTWARDENVLGRRVFISHWHVRVWIWIDEISHGLGRPTLGLYNS